MSGGAPQHLLRSVRNCANNTNIDTIQCEAYAPKLRQRPPLTGIMGPQPKSTNAKQQTRERSISRSRGIPSVGSSVSPAVRGPTAVPNHTRLRRENSMNSVIRKEVYTSADNPALVEVTVKTHGQQQQKNNNLSQQPQQQRKQPVKNNAGNRGEPWCKILQQNNVVSNVVTEGSSFSNFDPLRTVHFLAQELQSKLQDNLSDDDNNIKQIIADMQLALNRVPPEIASTLGLSFPAQYIQGKPPPSSILNGYNYDYPTRDDMKQERLLGVVGRSSATSLNTIERGCQTAKCKNMVLEPEKFQQHLEFSTAKIESACKQMEIVCSKLKTDKEELERDLLNERENVLKLRAQLDITATNQTATKLHLNRLETERDTLQKELHQIKSQLSNTASQTQLLHQMQSQRASAEEQLVSCRQQLTIAKMETEKYVAILAARDKQVTEIRSEMNQLQELVIEQLREIQTAPFSRSATSCTTNESSKPSYSWLPTSQNNPNSNSKEGFIDLERNIFKEIAAAMRGTSVGGTASSYVNGGETTTMTSVSGSGTSSTTTLHGARNSTNSSKQGEVAANIATIDLTADRQKSSPHTKVGAETNNDKEKTTNVMSCSSCVTTSNNQTNPGNNQQQQQENVVEQPQSGSIREMFAEIKKRALLINAQQKSA